MPKIPDLGLEGEPSSMVMPMQDDNTLRKHFLKLQEGGRSVFESAAQQQPVKRQAQPPNGPPPAKHTPSPARSGGGQYPQSSRGQEFMGDNRHHRQYPQQQAPPAQKVRDG